ncbi:glycosyltransferase family 1 protein [Enterococcus sp. LJL98]
MSEPIRILHVFGEMNRGGAETMIMNIYRNIDRSKIQFDFVVHTDEECAFDKEIEELGGTIYRVPRYTGKNHGKYKKAWLNFFEINSNHQIIHGHIRSTAAIYLKIAKKYRLKTIIHSHSTASGTGFSAMVKDLYQYPIRFIAENFLACSTDAGRWLFGKKKIEQCQFCIIRNAIESDKFRYNESLRDYMRKEFQIDNKFVIGHVGRFVHAKNHTFLIEIFKEISDINSSAVLLLVGEGEEKKNIEKKVRDLGLTSRVIFTGVRDDIPNILQALDVFLFPSLFEGLGLAVIEAQASGLPSIISDNIPLEVEITNLVKFISLKAEKTAWAKEVLAFDNYHKDRGKVDNKEHFKNSGYELEDTVSFIEEYYYSLLLK